MRAWREGEVGVGRGGGGVSKEDGSGLGEGWWLKLERLEGRDRMDDRLERVGLRLEVWWW